jgi:hypothetical protein
MDSCAVACSAAVTSGGKTLGAWMMAANIQVPTMLAARTMAHSRAAERKV